MKRGYEYAQKNAIAPMKKMVGKHAPDPKRPRRAPSQITPLEVAFMAILCFVIGVVVTLTVVSPETVRKVQSKEMFV
jgi:hypothetical protein